MKHLQNSAVDIAKAVICLADKSNQKTDNLQLQKILYFAQALSLVRNKKKLFPEKVEAWEYGPVIDTVYQEFKGYKKKPILCEDEYEKVLKGIYKKDQKVLEDTLMMLKEYNGKELVEITHSHLPWKEVYKEGENKEITPTALKTYYEGILA